MLTSRDEQKLRYERVKGSAIYLYIVYCSKKHLLHFKYNHFFACFFFLCFRCSNKAMICKTQKKSYKQPRIDIRMTFTQSSDINYILLYFGKMMTTDCLKEVKTIKNVLNSCRTNAGMIQFWT